jgi:hypothetical protein
MCGDDATRCHAHYSRAWLARPSCLQPALHVQRSGVQLPKEIVHLGHAVRGVGFVVPLDLPTHAGERKSTRLAPVEHGPVGRIEFLVRAAMERHRDVAGRQP